MPKMRGFLRSKSKIDEADWAIAEMRTAARLGDLFSPNGSPSAKPADETDETAATADLSSIIVGPSPWSGGPRPPIVVLGVSDVVSVLGQGGPADPPVVPADPEPIVDEIVSPAAPIGVMAEAGPPPVRERPDANGAIRVGAQTGGPSVEHEVSPAKPIGLTALGGESRRAEKPGPAEPAGVMGRAGPLLVKVKASPVNKVGVMARPGDAVGDDTWRLPTPDPADPGAVAAPPAAAYVFTTPPPPREHAPTEAPPERPVVAASAAAPAPEAEPPAARPFTAQPVGPAAAAQAGPDRSSVRRAAAGHAAPGRSPASRPGRTSAPAAHAPARRTTQVREPKAVPKVAAAPRAAAAPEPSVARPATGRSAAARRPTRRAGASQRRPVPAPSRVPVHVATAYCPYCAKLLDPVPTTSKRCDRCRQRIVVKRIDGSARYLTEAAVLVFEAERRRVVNSVRWSRDRDRWLRLASAAGAPPERQAQLAAARLTEDVVAAARKLYLTTVDRAFRAARAARDWEGAARVRRDEAAALYRVAGSPTPPPADVVEIFREGVAAELRGVAEIAREAELVSARCCDACRGDDRVIVRITQELRTPRLPHVECPRGLCRCHWDLPTRARMTMRRYLRRRPGAEPRVADAVPAADRAAASV